MSTEEPTSARGRFPCRCRPQLIHKQPRTTTPASSRDGGSESWAASSQLRSSRRKRYWARRADLKLAGWVFACGLLWEIAAEAFVEMANHGVFARSDDHFVTLVGYYGVAIVGMIVILLIKNRHSVARKARSLHRRHARRQQEQRRRRTVSSEAGAAGQRQGLMSLAQPLI